MSKQGFRQGRAAGLMFADFGQVRRDFALEQTTLFWTDLEPGVSEDQLKEDVQKIADRNFDPQSPLARQRRPQRGPREAGARDTGALVTLRSAESVRKQITERADGIIWALSQLPLVTLAVTSLGVVNTVLASIRARRWGPGRAAGAGGDPVFAVSIDRGRGDPGGPRGLRAQPGLRRDGGLLRDRRHALHEHSGVAWSRRSLFPGPSCRSVLPHFSFVFSGGRVARRRHRSRGTLAFAAGWPGHHVKGRKADLSNTAFLVDALKAAGADRVCPAGLVSHAAQVACPQTVIRKPRSARVGGPRSLG